MKKIALIIGLVLFSITVFSQQCSLRIMDNTPSAASSYTATFTLIYNDNGTPVQIGSPYSKSVITPNQTVDIPLPWHLPYDTQENLYILQVQVSELYGGNGTGWSAWFNTSFYYNNNINITVTL